jgi:hypothetical protein
MSQMGWFSQKLAVAAKQDQFELRQKGLSEKALTSTFLLERAFERLQTLTVIVNDSCDPWEKVRACASVANVMRQIAENEAHARGASEIEERIPTHRIEVPEI